jgi:hypothetical protein
MIHTVSWRLTGEIKQLEQTSFAQGITYHGRLFAHTNFLRSFLHFDMSYKRDLQALKVVFLQLWGTFNCIVILNVR